MRASDFLTSEERNRLESAITEAEHNTSGEIRIHIDRKCSSDPREKALKTFHKLGMTKTAARNAVLIYVACESRQFVVLGDKGINEAVPAGFWKDVCAILGESFSKGSQADGLEKAVILIGRKLKAFFPYQSDDINELSDEISIDEN
ncbi:MAG: TPM domain-containing protein [Bacteroidales bacterium]|nr:TPM domain-containing protein [Bacteroidales bacterium]